MTLTHLKIFIKVYQLENITHAAKELNMTQPAVSRAIKELEQYYNVCLFERIKRRLSRTECANQVYKHAIHIAESFEKMESLLHDWGETGSLRIGATVSLGNFLLPDLVAKFKIDYPKCQVYVRVANGHQLQEEVKENQLDFALVEGGIMDKELCTVPFINDRLRLIVPPDHDLNGQCISIKELAEYSLLVREQGSAGRSAMEHYFERHHLKIHPIWESNSTQAVVRAVHLGVGVALLPEHLVVDAIQRGFVGQCEVSDEEFLRSNFLVWHKHKFFTETATAFIQLCKEAREMYEL